MDWRHIDLNLLVVFQALMEGRGVTRAGEALGLSQPAMSASLARLRDLFDDPLFIRLGREMQPTPRALELADPVRRVLDAVTTDVLRRTGFDPATSTRQFTVLTPDIGEVNLVPPLLARLTKLAPGTSVRTLSRTAQATVQALESGEAELAFGHFPDLQRPGFYQQKLADVPFVYLVRTGHPTIGKRVTEREIARASFALVRPDGRGRDLDPLLTPPKAQVRVVVELAHFMSLLPVLEGSDLVAAAPRDIATVCVAHGDLRIVEMPHKAPTLAVYQFWHQRFHRDPAHAWFRALVQETCRDLGYGTSHAAGRPRTPASKPRAARKPRR